jgi:hypothetical protein
VLDEDDNYSNEDAPPPPPIIIHHTPSNTSSPPTITPKPLNHFGTFVTWSNWDIGKLGPSANMFRVFPNMRQGTYPQDFYNANTVVRDPYWDIRDFPNC